MKKMKLPLALLICVSMFSYSFTSTNQNSSFEKQQESKDLLNMKEMGEFSEFEDRRETSDKTVWQKRYKTWTDFTLSNEISAITSIIINNYEK